MVLIIMTLRMMQDRYVYLTVWVYAVIEAQWPKMCVVVVGIVVIAMKVFTSGQ